jgi:hypothetical protein
VLRSASQAGDEDMLVLMHWVVASNAALCLEDTVTGGEGRRGRGEVSLVR